MRAGRRRSSLLILMEDRKKISILLADDLGLVREGIASLCESTGLYYAMACNQSSSNPPH